MRIPADLSSSLAGMSGFPETYFMVCVNAMDHYVANTGDGSFLFPEKRITEKMVATPR